ncbi:MAG: AAA family ATPase [Bacilli bacterium]
MYLKEIRAHGFKSFADKIVINFENDITGIVGPNGSGKSNVVDAVRWVLGEQSVKSLRGTDNMTDVIFSGSKSRNPVNVASVTLVFDNSDHYLNVSYNEVTIKRRVYRDGTNEYYLNNERCRLKDIVEIMMDTGIAKESFNIISQGKIEEILSNKPTDRRVIFEEAAGVLKYKKRKEEALRKLDRTNDNMTRVEDIITELEIQVNPLKEQKEKAQEYLILKKELESLEVSLIANDIRVDSNIYKQKKEEIETIKRELLDLSTKNNKDDANLEKLKHKISEYQEKISSKNKVLLETTEKVEKINSRKNIILERQKYKVEDTKLHQSLVDLKEKELTIENELISNDNEITLKNIEITEFNTKYKISYSKITNLKQERNRYEISLSNLFRRENNLKSKIDILKNNIENNGILPYATKSILNNPKLRGIKNVIGNIIEVEDVYSTAISVALGNNTNNIIVTDESSAKDAINYLKSNNLGRATFFPLNIIKGRKIELTNEKNLNGFIGIASNLVKYDPIYKEIIENQLGNIIVAEDINSANFISNKTNYRYRVVTLDGQILHVGGSLTGGTSANIKNTISLKYELDNLIEEQKNILKETKKIEDEINIIDSYIAKEDDIIYLINKDRMLLLENIKNKEALAKNLSNNIEYITSEIKSINNMMNNNLSNEENQILKEYYEEVSKKELVLLDLQKLTNDIETARDELETFEHTKKSENTIINAKNKELNNLEVDVNRLDVKLDNLLNILNETYNITFEKAISEFILDIDISSARTKVLSLKRKLKEIGMVNINAIEEYDRVSTRYQFLIGQKEDLKKAEDTLLEIIREMDSVMEDEFIKTFEIIKKNFSETFVELFKGGKAELKLTDPNNILETGIEIIASPPGKKLTTIQLLSGGEKTFTAISLLFAILKSRPVPFCILDEVEAALDDSNVNSFGEYLNKLKEKTQFILITHKKKTMEFVNSLYGITMQESGVSKIVSVKLEEVK